MPTRRSLDRLTLSACSRTWDSLEPVSSADTQRYCDQCELHVHDLAKRTRAEASELINGREGRLCVMTTHDTRGELVTRGAARSPLWRFASRAASFWVFLFASLTAACPRQEESAQDADGAEGDADEQDTTSVEERLRALGGLELIGYVGE